MRDEEKEAKEAERGKLRMRGRFGGLSARLSCEYFIYMEPSSKYETSGDEKEAGNESDTSLQREKCPTISPLFQTLISSPKRIKTLIHSPFPFALDHKDERKPLKFTFSKKCLLNGMGMIFSAPGQLPVTFTL